MSNWNGPRDQSWIDERRRQRMARIDQMPYEVRTLVHEYGLNTVNSFLDCGVRDPRRIRHLVEVVLDEFSPTRGARSSQGLRNAPGFVGVLDE